MKRPQKPSQVVSIPAVKWDKSREEFPLCLAVNCWGVLGVSLITLSWWQTVQTFMEIHEFLRLDVQPLWRDGLREIRGRVQGRRANFLDVLVFGCNAEPPSKHFICTALSACLKCYQESFILARSSTAVEECPSSIFRQAVTIFPEPHACDRWKQYFAFDAHVYLDSV